MSTSIYLSIGPSFQTVLMFGLFINPLTEIPRQNRSHLVMYWWCQGSRCPQSVNQWCVCLCVCVSPSDAAAFHSASKQECPLVVINVHAQTRVWSAHDGTHVQPWLSASSHHTLVSDRHVWVKSKGDSSRTSEWEMCQTSGQQLITKHHGIHINHCETVFRKNIFPGKLTQLNTDLLLQSK